VATFKLTSGPDTLDFDIQGNVTKAGASFGAWTVTNDNQLQVQPAGGGAPLAIAVDWGFNGQNQLELRQAGAVAFNFHKDATIRPDLQTDHGVLFVTPDQNNENFSFDLRGTWNLAASFDLLFTAGTVTSTIQGILKDTVSSEFGYIFISQGPVARQYELDFTGAWSQQPGAGMDVSFTYDTEDPKKPGTIDLPPGLTIDPIKNILVYTYNKGTHTGSLELAGSLRINSNFSLTYVLDSQDVAGIRSTMFAISAVINQGAVGEGNLQLTVKRSGADTSIQIGGSYRGVIAGLDLTVGFTYARTVSGTQITDTVGFTGKVVNPGNGNTFQWSFDLGTQGGTVHFDIDVTAHIKLSAGKCLNAALNVSVQGQQVAITAMFGISTNCGAEISLPSNQKLSLKRRNLLNDIAGLV
jgi:hypothetical protein